MDSQDWRRSVWFEDHQTSRDEVTGLMAQAARCLADSGIAGVSPETRHAAAHNAVLYVAKAALAASGLRTTESHHYWAVESLKHTIGIADDLADELHRHRKKRHASSYEYNGMVSEQELHELVQLATELRSLVVDWLRTTHADLLAEE